MTLRRKRLLLALATMPAFSAGCWWLTRPVIDPRLVGTWEESFRPSHMSTVACRVYWADGTGEHRFHGGDAAPFRWAVEGDVLTEHFGGIENTFDNLIQELVGRRWFSSEDQSERSRISFRSDDEAVIVPIVEDSYLPRRLTRVPD